MNIPSLDPKKIAACVSRHRERFEDFFDRPRSIPELAELLNTTDRFIWEEIRRGKLKSFRFGHKLVRLMPSDVLDWINKHQLEAAAKEKQAA